MTEIRESLQSYITAEMDDWDFSGVVRIIQNGRILFETCRGYSNIEFGIKNTMETRFAVASVAKQFTAFAIMILHDRGLLQLDEKANRYLPANMQLPSEITVHHLLSHTSGLHNNYNFEDDFYVGEDRKPYNKERFFRDWIIKEPIKKPGKEFEYNNSNYNLLAWIIEYVSGLTYNEFLQENIFSKIGMNNTLLDNGQDIIPNKASNYMHDYGKLYLVRVNQNIHIELYCVGKDSFKRRCEEQQTIHKLISEGDRKPSVWGYELISKQFV